MSPVPNESLYQVSGNLGKASCASVALNGVDYFFYYRSGDNELACLKSNDESKETEIGKTTFSSSTILNGSSDVITQVNAISPLAATDWSYGTSGETGIRLYYVQDNTDIKELYSTDGTTWNDGDFNTSKFKIASTGGLSASFHETGGLRVFFADADNDGNISMAYQKGDCTWTKMSIK